MPAGDAGLEVGPEFRERTKAGVQPRLWEARVLLAQVDRLQAQVTALGADLERITADAQHWNDVARQQQAVIDAARGAVNCIDADDPAGLHFSGGGCLDLLDKALAALDEAQAAQPEGEQAR